MDRSSARFRFMWTAVATAAMPSATTNTAPTEAEMAISLDVELVVIDVTLTTYWPSSGESSSHVLTWMEASFGMDSTEPNVVQGVKLR